MGAFRKSHHRRPAAEADAPFFEEDAPPPPPPRRAFTAREEAESLARWQSARRERDRQAAPVAHDLRTLALYAAALATLAAAERAQRDGLLPEPAEPADSVRLAADLFPTDVLVEDTWPARFAWREDTQTAEGGEPVGLAAAFSIRVPVGTPGTSPGETVWRDAPRPALDPAPATTRNQADAAPNPLAEAAPRPQGTTPAEAPAAGPAATDGVQLAEAAPGTARGGEARIADQAVPRAGDAPAAVIAGEAPEAVPQAFAVADAPAAAPAGPAVPQAPTPVRLATPDPAPAGGDAPAAGPGPIVFAAAKDEDMPSGRDDRPVAEAQPPEPAPPRQEVAAREVDTPVPSQQAALPRAATGIEDDGPARSDPPGLARAPGEPARPQPLAARDEDDDGPGRSDPPGLSRAPGEPARPQQTAARDEDDGGQGRADPPGLSREPGEPARPQQLATRDETDDGAAPRPAEPARPQQLAARDERGDDGQRGRDDDDASRVAEAPAVPGLDLDDRVVRALAALDRGRDDDDGPRGRNDEDAGPADLLASLPVSLSGDAIL